MSRYDIKKLYFSCQGIGSSLVLLHGWGCDGNIFNEIKPKLTSNYKVYAIDLPGFGNSPEPESNWGTFEYSTLVEWFLQEHNIVEPVLICHSFGGRVAIDLASRIENIKALVLTGSAGIKQKKGLSTIMKILCFKLLKNISRLGFLNEYERKQFKNIQSKFGSSDYKSSSPMMKSILTKVINEDLTHLLSKIKIPTLLIWGENDSATPIKDGITMHDIIPNSNLVVFSGAGHYAFLDKPFEFTSNVLEFLKNLKRG